MQNKKCKKANKEIEKIDGEREVKEASHPCIFPRIHGHYLISVFNFDNVCCTGNLNTKQQSQYLKDDGIVIFALGIGPQVHSGELKALASEESHMFRFTSFSQMLPADSALGIALALCSGR